MDEAVVYQIGRPADGCNRGRRRRGETRGSTAMGFSRTLLGLGDRHFTQLYLPATRLHNTSFRLGS